MLTAVILLIICSTADSVRLVDGAGLCSGRVEVESHQSWTTVCETDFDWQDAEVVCRELDCGTPVKLQGALFGEGTHPFGNKEFQCKGNETSLLTCSTSDRQEHTCTHGNATELTCSGVQVKPSISFSSPAPTSSYFPRKHEIRIFTDFNITCSIEPQFTGGVFKLRVPWTTEIFTQRADNHSASYLCPEVGLFSHRGNYSCIYENDDFTSESETLTIYMREWDDVRLVDGSSYSTGIVEMFHSGQWWKVRAMGTSKSDSLKLAEVVCRQLRFSSGHSASKIRANSKRMQFLSSCSGFEFRLRGCELVLQHQTDFIERVVCSGPARGAEGPPGRGSGRPFGKPMIVIG